MLKAKELQGSIWQDFQGDTVVVRKQKGIGYIASGNSYQIVEKSATKFQEQLKKAGFEFIGWD